MMRVVLMALLLSGCVSSEQMAARDNAQCAAYGFRPGSDGYAGCMQRLDMARRQAVMSAAPVVTTCSGGVCTSY